MAGILKNLLGNSARDHELGEEVRAALQEMREERAKFEQLLARSGDAVDRLAGLDEPLARVQGDADSALTRISEVEARIAALDALAGRIQALGETADGIATTQERMQAELAAVSDDSARIRTVFEEQPHCLGMAYSHVQSGGATSQAFASETWISQ